LDRRRDGGYWNLGIDQTSCDIGGRRPRLVLDFVLGLLGELDDVALPEENLP
jgi:hypothetical protein